MARKKDFFDEEQERIESEMAKLDVRSQEYKELRQELKDMIALRGESRESKRRISKADKGQILLKFLTGGASLAAILGIAKFERDGNTFTGEKRSLIDVVATSMSRIFYK